MISTDMEDQRLDWGRQRYHFHAPWGYQKAKDRREKEYSSYQQALNLPIGKRPKDIITLNSFNHPLLLVSTKRAAWNWGSYQPPTRSL